MNARCLILLTLLSLSASAQTPAPVPAPIPTPGGKVVAASERQQRFWYEDWHFAPARVEGNLVFVSGIVAGAPNNQPVDTAGLEAAFRRAWSEVKLTLEAAGASTDSIVDLTTYHVFGSPLFAGSKREHIAAFRRVKDEFVPAPYPTWTGIGVATLFPDNGLVEIKVVARVKP